MQLSPGGGWQEAVTSVHDLGRWIEALDHLAGWSVAHRGQSSSRLLSAWSLPDSVTADEAVLVCPEDSSRWLRLMAFNGTPQRQIRSSGQPWESGGIFSLLAYSNDVNAALSRAHDLGWLAHNDPVLMEFGDRELRNVVLRGPDGCNFGLYQPLKPVPEKPFPFDKLGPPFNGQQMVRNAAASQSFYEQALGWESWFSGSLTLGCNNFGIPENLMGKHPKNVSIMHGAPNSYGQVELVQWTGLFGRDFAEHARPPNLGHLALRLCVDDLPATVAQLGTAGIDLYAEPSTLTLEPFGEVDLCTIRTPDGALFDLLQHKH